MSFWARCALTKPPKGGQQTLPQGVETTSQSTCWLQPPSFSGSPASREHTQPPGGKGGGV